MSHQTCSARRTELRALRLTDYVYDENGNPVRRRTTSGRGAFVEVATADGKNTIRFGWRINTGRDPTKGHHKDNRASAAAFASIDPEACARRVLELMVKFS
jgi:hypothetical protein